MCVEIHSSVDHNMLKPRVLLPSVFPSLRGWAAESSGAFSQPLLLRPSKAECNLIAVNAGCKLSCWPYEKLIDGYV